LAKSGVISFNEVSKTDLGELLAMSKALSALNKTESEAQSELYLAVIKGISTGVANAIAKLFSRSR
jgi:hypothetical protein